MLTVSAMVCAPKVLMRWIVTCRMKTTRRSDGIAAVLRRAVGAARLV